jgi:hypothetical protein
MAVHYLEIVSNDAETLTALYQRMHGLSFGPPTRTSGTLVLPLKRTEPWWASGSPWRRMSSRSYGATSRSKTSNEWWKGPRSKARPSPIPRPDRDSGGPLQSSSRATWNTDSGNPSRCPSTPTRAARSSSTSSDQTPSTPSTPRKKGGLGPRRGAPPRRSGWASKGTRVARVRIALPLRARRLIWRVGDGKSDAPRRERCSARRGVLTMRALGAREKNSGSDLLSHMETMQYHRL